jgi:hypothetical protein
MTQEKFETASKLRITVPGIVPFPDTPGALSTTGTVNGFPEIEEWRAFLKRNITARAGTLDDRIFLHFYNLPQAIGMSTASQGDLFWRPYGTNNVDGQARAFMKSMDSKAAADEAISILDTIQGQLAYYDAVELPPIAAFRLDNGSLGLEWAVDHFRVGFNFELDSAESGYFLISDAAAGEVRNYGYLHGLNKRSLVKSILTLILEN